MRQQDQRKFYRTARPGEEDFAVKRPDGWPRRQSVWTKIAWLAVLCGCLHSAGCAVLSEQDTGPLTVTEWMRQPKPGIGTGVLGPMPEWNSQ